MTPVALVDPSVEILRFKSIVDPNCNEAVGGSKNKLIDPDEVTSATVRGCAMLLKYFGMMTEVPKIMMITDIAMANLIGLIGLCLALAMYSIYHLEKLVAIYL